MKKRKGTYTPAPSVPSELEARYATVVAILTGEMTVSEAAERLSLSRVQMQTLVHRAKESLVAGLSPRPPGRAPKSDRELELEQRIATLERQNAQMQSRSETAERLMEVMGGSLRGRVKANGRSGRRPAATKATTGEPEEPEPGGLATEARRMLEIGLTLEEAAKVLGVGATTLRRHLRGREPKRCEPPPLDTAAIAVAAELVRTTHGLIGAGALGHATGLSRRSAAAVKEKTLLAMERERVAGCARVTVTRPGVMRGFDQLWVSTASGRGLVLVCADGAIPYRTSLVVAERYDSASVAAALDADFTANGAPLVCRLDRASCHRTDEVDEVLARHGVLRLHGPPRYPQYYAQLERQNREHQAWLAGAPGLTVEALPAACRDMRAALNDAWPRRSLGWMTAAEKWASRDEPCDDRAALRAEVADRAARLRRHRRRSDDLDELVVQRLAIENALTTRGYLRREQGGWC